MDDPLLVCGFERFGDLSCDQQRFVDRGAAAYVDRRGIATGL
jgi:hypothetical protein